MRDKNRIKPFLEELGKIWEENCPDWRFGQLMFNVFSATGDPFYFEEDKMLKEIKKYFKITDEIEKMREENYEHIPRID